MPRLIETQEIPFSPLRGRILAFLHNRGGATLTEMARFAGRSNTTLLWHLQKLQKADVIAKNGATYVIRQGSSLTTSALALHDALAGRLLADLVRNPGSTLGECALRLERARSTLATRLKVLVGHRLVWAQPLGTKVGWFPTSLGRRTLGHLPVRRPRSPIPPARSLQDWGRGQSLPTAFLRPGP